MNMKHGLIFVVLLGLSLNGFAEERITMDGLKVIGNKEMPNILYILPWQTAKLPTMVELPLSGLIKDALQPIDRESVLRKKFYQEIVQGAVPDSANTVEAK